MLNEQDKLVPFTGLNRWGYLRYPGLTGERKSALVFSDSASTVRTSGDTYEDDLDTKIERFLDKEGEVFTYRGMAVIHTQIN